MLVNSQFITIASCQTISDIRKATK